LSLLGQAETGPYSWNGHLSDLKTQIAHSIRSTMASDHQVASQMVDDIAAYVTALPAPPSLSQARRAHSTSEQQHTLLVESGSRLFAELSCADCHSGDWFTSPETYDVGLSDEAQQRRFNPPSLVAVSQRQHVLLHDGRASSLHDLLQNHPHQLKRDLTEPEIDQLVAYLEGL
jgi:cytochrome c peroxidase